MRERIAELETQLAAAEEDADALRRQLRSAQVRLTLLRTGRAVAAGGVGTFAGLGMMMPIASLASGGLGLVAFGGIVGGLFGLLIGLGSEIAPR